LVVWDNVYSSSLSELLYTGAIDLSVLSSNRVFVRSKPASLRGSDSTKLVVPLLSTAYYNNSYFPRSVNSYNKLIVTVKNMSYQILEQQFNLYIYCFMYLFLHVVYFLDAEPVRAMPFSVSSWAVVLCIDLQSVLCVLAQ
jgi:hypothetical protein